MVPKDRRPPTLMMALHIWAMAHGIASLFVRELSVAAETADAGGGSAEAGVLLYLQSLGLAGGG